MPVRLVLWDVDHTLVELHRLHYDLYRRALTAAFDKDAEYLPDMSGRTDRESSTKMLAAHGIEPDPDNLHLFWKRLVEQFDQVAPDLPGTGHAVDGAPAVLAALWGRSDVFQSVLTGNLRALAERKLGLFGLDRYLDLDIGGYGEDDVDRASLVAVASGRVTARHGVVIGPADTILVGDTPNDVKAAHDSGARAVAVATGRTTAEELARAGADAVLADLQNTDAVVRAILTAGY